MENQPRNPQGGENSCQQANSYGTDHPVIQASIEQARTEAAVERRRNRERLERYVDAGLDPDDAEAVVEFGYFVRSQRANNTSADQDPLPDPQPGQQEDEPECQPAVHVIDMAGQAQGVEHGLWIDANQPPDQVNRDIAAMLESSPTTGDQAWEVDVARGFAGIDVIGLSDPDLITRLARGVADHGPAYAAYVKAVGVDDVERLDQFTEDLGWQEQLDRASLDPLLRPYVVIDYCAMAEDGARSWGLVEGSDGRTHVFLR